MTPRKLVIGTRGSKLALFQAELVRKAFRAVFSDLETEIKIIKTRGDKIVDVPLSKVGDKGIFTKELETAILEGEADMAVHSLKDLPTRLPDGLEIGAVLSRGEVRDALISRNHVSFDRLPEGAVIGTSSLRRKSQILFHRPDLILTDMRGNVDSRIRKLDEGVCDALVLAGAGLIRLGFDHAITQYFDPVSFIPAASQGIICIESREHDKLFKPMLGKINHPATFQMALAERAFLHALEGGCQVPMGCYSILKNIEMTLHGFIADLNGKKMIKTEKTGLIQNGCAIAIQLANELLNMGGKEILREIRSSI